MGNAPESVQEQVEYVTAPIEGDGLAKALIHYGLADANLLHSCAAPILE
jgi:hydroxymethylpyrimidine pyrophosphatase-like HAD family hydrolase